MLRSPRYGLPPPPVPRIHAPTAKASMSSKVIRADISRRYRAAVACLTVRRGLTNQTRFSGQNTPILCFVIGRRQRFFFNYQAELLLDNRCCKPGWNDLVKLVSVGQYAMKELMQG